jgi:Co/Zn/Cd efflux system component
MTHDAHADTTQHGHHHDHGHSTRGGKIGAALLEVFAPHSHDASDSIDGALESSAAGIRAVKISLLALGATAIVQVVIVLISGSVALLADTIHNFSDALTAIPLWIAFALSTKPATRRYTYGFGRAEDLAGLFGGGHDHPVGHHRRNRIGASPDQPRSDRACRLGRPGRSGGLHRQ